MHTGMLLGENHNSRIKDSIRCWLSFKNGVYFATFRILSISFKSSYQMKM